MRETTESRSRVGGSNRSCISHELCAATPMARDSATRSVPTMLTPKVTCVSQLPTAHPSGRGAPKAQAGVFGERQVALSR
jgi:hypothetical protein